mmetsp:Transcript_11868/g.35516  ORF Transcript_11868/g.35516 Transcript_11868/m.35516 type:complete len:260 (+) Transcript_11868:385-1164(+)
MLNTTSTTAVHIDHSIKDMKDPSRVGQLSVNEQRACCGFETSASFSQHRLFWYFSSNCRLGRRNSGHFIPLSCISGVRLLGGGAGGGGGGQLQGLLIVQLGLQCLQLRARPRILLRRQRVRQCFLHGFLGGLGLSGGVHEGLHVSQGHLPLQLRHRGAARLQRCQELGLLLAGLHGAHHLLHVQLPCVQPGELLLVEGAALEGQQGSLLVVGRHQCPRRRRLPLHQPLQPLLLLAQLVALRLQRQQRPILIRDLALLAL